MNIKLFLVVTVLTSLLCSVAAKKRVLSDHGQKEKSDLKREGNFRNPLWKRDPASLQPRSYCTCKEGPHRGEQGAWYIAGCPEYLDYCGSEPVGDCCYPAE